MVTTPLLDALFLSLTWLGSLALLLPATMVYAAGLWRSNLRDAAQLLGAGLCLSAALARLLKLLFRCPRPIAGELLVSMPAGWSFPSAHAAQATAFFLTLALLAHRLRPGAGAHVTALICGFLAVTVGFSRLYLRVHFFTDVLAGTLLGATLVAVLVRAKTQSPSPSR